MSSIDETCLSFKMTNNETQRLEAVNRLMRMDNSIDEDLNDLVKLTAQICNTPIALISLIDEDMQWFKAAQGVDIHCNTREASFCKFTIQQNDVLIIPDMTLDERVQNHPLVANQPMVRFYAGANLTTQDGLNVGTLCVLDVAPRELDNMQKAALKTLAKQVMNLMDLNRSLQSLNEHQQQREAQNEIIASSELKLKAMFDSFEEQHVLLGRDLEVLAFNKAAARYILGRFHKPLGVGHNFMEYNDHTNAVGFERFFQFCNEGLAGNFRKVEMPLRGANNEMRWAEISFHPVRDDHHEIIGVAVNSFDITERRLQEEEIKAKNEALRQIALMQSHELRRPVASLKGLMELIKHDETVVSSEYYGMITAIVNELDEKIFDIVKASEENINAEVFASNTDAS